MKCYKMLLPTIVLVLALSIISGCGIIQKTLATPTSTPTNTPIPTETPTPQIISRELGQEGNPIIWAFVPSVESEKMAAGTESVTRWLQEETGLYFEIVTVTEYTGLLEAMCSNPPQAQMGSLPAFGYLLAAGWGCAESELIAIRHGSATYNSQIITRIDSDIQSINDLPGTTFCRPTPLSTTGWVLPTLMMLASGIYPDYDLADIVDSGTPEAVVTDVYNGVCAAGATYVDARSSIESDYPDVMEQVIVVARGEEIPNEGVQYTPNLPQELRDQITAALLRMMNDEEGQEALQTAFGWDGFEPHNEAYYELLRQRLEDAGLDENLNAFPQ